ncbi:Methyltransferase type 11 [Ketogulonicigenium robustum]|uniref:Methyltransferase type 11 n=1 Tax=Ketogulonicigenium robustum TaxID=92947 RepID=A0A1W6NXU9_9RHOB|nr:class I SAM-dependent methyltransferase [Ketogulonicigenium robustum]ARO14062.1 Methyltransferase type 11 [Ketogulonicigenium robustum]
MTDTNHTHVEKQFGPRAQAYVDSATHAQGDDLTALEAVLRQHRPQMAIDLGAGGGHVAYRMAALADHVLAVDLSQDMLMAVNETARARGITNLTTQFAPAEMLSLPDEHADFLASRFSAHHWHDLHSGLREAYRVLKPGARSVFIDTVSPRSAIADSHLQAIELLRDPSHVRDYSAAEWVAAVGNAGFNVQDLRHYPLRLAFQPWVQRSGTPMALVAALLQLQSGASDPVRKTLKIEEDGSFTVDTVFIVATRP